MKRISVNIITGFLGSGKTTVICNLLQNKSANEKWAVIINEFGEVGIDTTTLNDQASAGDNIVEVAGGCICCTSKDYFEAHLREIIDGKSPDRIIVEPTGLGGIQMVKEIIAQFPELTVGLIICLVDVRGEGIERLRMNQIYLSQIRDSDIIAISKCDIENSEKKSKALLEWIKKEFQPKPIYTCIEKGKLDLKLLSLNSDEGETVEDELGINILRPYEKEDAFEQNSFTYPAKQVFELKTIERIFSNSEYIIRAKGYLNIGKSWILFNAVMGEFNYTTVTEKDENKIVLITAKSTTKRDIPDTGAMLQAALFTSSTMA
jgi:G3E family GTPase